MRVGFDATPLCRKIDGVGRYTRELIRNYAEAHPDQTILLIGFVGDTIEASELLDFANIRFVRIPIPRPAYGFSYSRFFRIPVNIFIPSLDIFIATNFRRFPLITNTPSLVAVHDLAYVHYPETIERKNLARLRKHVSLAMKEATGILSTSNFTAKEIEEVFKTHPPIFNVSNAIDLRRWKPSDLKRNEYILAVGTLEPRKNLARLIKAHQALATSVREAHQLVVVGSGGWGDVRTKPDPFISYTGYVDDESLLRLYQEASLFVLPSVYEGFGIPVLEALATNTTIVCADIPPLREIAGSHATYFNPLSVSGMKIALQAGLKKGVTKTHDAAKKFSWENSVRALDEAIRRSLAD